MPPVRRAGRLAPTSAKPDGAVRGGRAGAAAVQRSASAAAATLPEPDVDSSAMSTDNKTTKAKSGRGDATAASGTDRPPASTKRAMLIGMLERAEGASVTEIGQRLGWLPIPCALRSPVCVMPVARWPAARTKAASPCIASFGSKLPAGDGDDGPV